MKFFITSDKWRGSLSAREVCLYIEKGIRHADPNAQIELCPLADGGEGSLVMISEKTEGEWIELLSEDALGRPVNSRYFLDGKGVAYVESAFVLGHQYLRPEEKNPFLAHSRGLGIVLRSIQERGVKEVHIFLGGTVTCDGGMGMLEALGIRFFNLQGKLLTPKGENLHKIYEINTHHCLNFDQIRWHVWCDVLAPLTGPKGAALLFSKQKGADEKMALFLEEGMKNYQYRIAQKFQLSDIGDRPGYGAAGGLGFAFNVFLNGKTGLGSDFFLLLNDCEKKVMEADVILTGEGKFDHQSLLGKITGEIALLAKKHQKPCYVVCGIRDSVGVDLADQGISGIFSLREEEPNEQKSIKYAAELLEKTGIKLVRTLKAGGLNS